MDSLSFLITWYNILKRFKIALVSNFTVITLFSDSFLSLLLFPFNLSYRYLAYSLCCAIYRIESVCISLFNSFQNLLFLNLERLYLVIFSEAWAKHISIDAPFLELLRRVFFVKVFIDLHSGGRFATRAPKHAHKCLGIEGHCQERPLPKRSIYALLPVLPRILKQATAVWAGVRHTSGLDLSIFTFPFILTIAHSDVILELSKSEAIHFSCLTPRQCDQAYEKG